MKYCYPLLLLFILSCNTRIQYPAGGFEYPAHVAAQDTNFYYYPLKDIEQKRDAFQDAYAYLFYQPFNEPNLSIKPQAKETFRLTYGGAIGDAIIITITEDLLTVKKGSPHILYVTDTSQLSAIEKFHFRLLQRAYPLDTTGQEPFRKKYYDSVTTLYPQMLDPAYYHALYKRTIAPSGEKFNYTVASIALSKEQYISLIKEINASGFWKLPYSIQCENAPMDGSGFTLEANTKEKYQIVYASYCPGDTTRFIKTCWKIIDMAKIDSKYHSPRQNGNNIIDSAQ